MIGAGVLATLLAAASGCADARGPSSARRAAATTAAQPSGSPAPSQPRAQSTATPPARAVIKPPHGSALAATAARRCAVKQLAVRVGARSGEAEQTLTIVVLTNTGPARCDLDGYPSLAADFGRASRRRTGPLRVVVHDGPTYFRRDLGPRRVVLPPGGSASFALETELGFNGGADAASITRLAVVPPGDRASLALPIDLGLDGPLGQPYPILVTALVAGRAGPPQ